MVSRIMNHASSFLQSDSDASGSIEGAQDALDAFYRPLPPALNYRITGTSSGSKSGLSEVTIVHPDLSTPSSTSSQVGREETGTHDQTSATTITTTADDREGGLSATERSYRLSFVNRQNSCKTYLVIDSEGLSDQTKVEGRQDESGGMGDADSRVAIYEFEALSTGIAIKMYCCKSSSPDHDTEKEGTGPSNVRTAGIIKSLQSGSGSGPDGSILRDPIFIIDTESGIESKIQWDTTSIANHQARLDEATASRDKNSANLARLYERRARREERDGSRRGETIASSGGGE